MQGKQLQGIRDRAERRALIRRFMPRAEHGGIHRTLVRAPASLGGRGRRDVTFRAVPPEAFADFDEPGLVKIAWSLEAEPLGPALTRFSTETRVAATDDTAREKFERYWRRAGAGIILTHVLLLPMLRREAERRFRARSAA